MSDIEWERLGPASPGPTAAASSVSPAAAPMFWVHVGGQLGGKLVLDGDRLVLGRATTCDVVLDDHTVSSAHLELSRHGGVVLAVDLGSRNGTLLNGRPLDRPTRLRDGDILVLGGARLQLVLPTVAGMTRTEPASSVAAKMTDQEREVAGALVAAFRVPGALAPRPATRAEIADAVHLSERTVQRRLDSLGVKLELPAHAPRERAHALAQRILELGLDAQR